MFVAFRIQWASSYVPGRLIMENDEHMFWLRLLLVHRYRLLFLTLNYPNDTFYVKLKGDFEAPRQIATFSP